MRLGPNQGREWTRSAASIEFGQGRVDVVVPLDPDCPPVSDRVDLAYGRPNDFRTARSSPDVDAQANEDTVAAFAYLLNFDRRRASGSVKEVLKSRPYPSQASARPPLDRIFRVDELDLRVHQLFESRHHSVHGLAAVDHLERSAH